MAHLEDLIPGAVVKGVQPEGTVTTIAGKWIGNAAIEITYRDPAAHTARMPLSLMRHLPAG